MDRLAEWHIVPVLSWDACHVAVSFPPLHKFVNAVTKFEFASSLQEAFAAMFLDPQNRRNTTWRVLLGCVLGVSLLSARAWLCSMPHTLPGHTLRGDFRHFGNKQCLEHNDATVTPPSAVAMPELVPQFVVFTARSASVAVYSLYGTHYDRPPPS